MSYQLQSSVESASLVCPTPASSFPVSCLLIVFRPSGVGMMIPFHLPTGYVVSLNRLTLTYIQIPKASLGSRSSLLRSLRWPRLVFPYCAYFSNIPHVFRAPSVSSVSSPPVPSLLLLPFPYVTLTLRPWAQHLCFPAPVPVHLQSPLLGEPFFPSPPASSCPSTLSCKATPSRKPFSLPPSSIHLWRDNY